MASGALLIFSRLTPVFWPSVVFLAVDVCFPDNVIFAVDVCFLERSLLIAVDDCISTKSLVFCCCRPFF